MKKTKVVSLILGLSFLLLACNKQGGQEGAGGPDQDQDKLSVVSSFFVLEDFARKIGGDRVQVEPLIPAGQSPHGWEPSPRDIDKIQKADVFIYNGAGLEGWLDKIVDGLDPNKVLLVEASKGVSLMEGHSHDHDHDHDGVEDHDHDHEALEDHDDHDHDHEALEGHEDHDHDHEALEDHDHDHGGMDPHVWTSPKNARILAENIYKGLAQKDPANRDYYEENFKSLEKDLAQLDKDFQETLAKAKSRDIVVSHEAYGYLARDYGLNQLPIEGINSQSEPDPKTMQKIVDFMKEKKTSTIFTEPLIDPKVAQTIAKETGAQVEVLDPLEGLAKGEDKADKSYIGLMRANLEALKKALVE